MYLRDPGIFRILDSLSDLHQSGWDSNPQPVSDSVKHAGPGLTETAQCHIWPEPALPIKLPELRWSSLLEGKTVIHVAKKFSYENILFS